MRFFQLGLPISVAPLMKVRMDKSLKVSACKLNEVDEVDALLDGEGRQHHRGDGADVVAEFRVGHVEVEDEGTRLDGLRDFRQGAVRDEDDGALELEGSRVALLFEVLREPSDDALVVSIEEDRKSSPGLCRRTLAAYAAS